MGVLQDQIAAIRANNALSEEEKRTAIYAVKCNGLKDYIGFVDSSQVARYLGKPFVFDGMTIVIHAVSVSQQPPLSLFISVTRTRQSDGHSETDVLQIVNPPVLDRTGQENLAQVVGQMLTSVPFKG